MNNPKFDVFVIMPFDAEFQDVFDLIKRLLEKECGRKVLRADESVNQQNILQDIVHSIQGSEIIIADLTGRNPNVFYELGLAHALDKNVILMAQDIEEIPFDLRPYRVILYSTHFSKIDDFKNKLKRIMGEIEQGTMSFGNPVKDWLLRYGPGDIAQPTHLLQPNDLKNAEPELEEDGIIDSLADVKESSEHLTVLMKEFTSKTESLSNAIIQITSKIQRITSVDPKLIDPASIRKHLRKAASGLNEYGLYLVDFNKKYDSSWNTFERGLLQLVKNNRIPKDNQDYNEFLVLLEQMKEQMISAREKFALMATSMDGLKGLQKDVTRACGIVQREIKLFVGILEKAIATIDVVLQ